MLQWPYIHTYKHTYTHIAYTVLDLSGNVGGHSRLKLSVFQPLRISSQNFIKFG